MTTTTLSAAVSTTDTTITVASATGISARGDYGKPQTYLYIGDEAMEVVGVNGTQITVRRGVLGMGPIQAHGIGTTVMVATSAEAKPVYNSPSTQEGLNFAVVRPATVATATAVTLTAAQVLGGFVLQDPSGGGVTTTLPTAVLLLAAISARVKPVIGTSFEFTIKNTADAAETITVAAGTGGTTSGTMTIAQNNTKRFKVVFTGVNSGAEAYTVYSLGTAVH